MNKRKNFNWALQAFSFLAALVFLTQTAAATTAKLASDEQLILTSRVIVTGDVQAIQAAWDGQRRNIYTYVTVKVSEVLKGQIRNETIVIKQAGGRVGDDEIIIDGAPKYKAGQSVLLFLNTLPDGALTVAHLFQGKYEIIENAETGLRIAQRTIDSDNVHILPGQGEQVTNSAELSAFIEKIRATLRYSPKETSAKYRAASIREIPAEYRGDMEDMSAKTGGSADFYYLNGGSKWFSTFISYYLNTANSPVAGGGINELQRGLSAWTNVGTSNLTLSFAGTTFRQAQQSPNDGFNVIAYNGAFGADNENCSGVGASTSRRVNFGQTTVVNGRTFVRILESDIQVNNNFPCFLSDPENLAFVFSHELGHTIGLDHSFLTSPPPGTDPIMAPFGFGGRGPELGMDDVNGISFAYPQPFLNPIDDPRYFVGQQYRDFLNREPDLPGWNFWTGTIVNTCGSDPACISTKKVDVSRAFFYSSEFLSQHPGLRNPEGVYPDFNNAEFVRLCYVVFLRRDVDPNDPGYQFWLNELNSNNDYNHIIHAFHESGEYRNRPFLFYGLDQ
ncbi:MAG TPA: DUF4214 domain-containing protein [Pyrinomonadaceae bacterium]|nr:DUF4214 domain-containing protein [Pyrinomonadaceae bacterium]